MGVLGYSIKYKMYPHAALLEMLSETGLLGALLILALLVLALIRILRNSTETVSMLLFLFPYGLAANISGTMWTSVPMLFALGYGLSLKRIGQNKT